MDLFHVKPHGSLYGMAAKSPEVAKAVADAAKVFNVPVLGMAGTMHEQIYTAAGLEFISEYYADLDYADDGTLIITREHHAVDPKRAAEGALRAVKEGVAKSVNGRKCTRPRRLHLRPLRHAERGRGGAGGQGGGRRISWLAALFREGGARMAQHQVLSPLPGIFYRRPAPEKPPYKEDGDRVAEGDVIGLVEVMKQFTEVQADASGKIVRFLVDNEAAVEAGAGRAAHRDRLSLTRVRQAPGRQSR